MSAACPERTEPRIVPSKAQWAALEQQLAGAYGQVKLRCDQYELTLQVVPVGARRYEIQPYVNGFWRGIWLSKDKTTGAWPDEAVRFFRPVSRPMHSVRMRKLLKKLDGKKYVEARHDYYKSSWTSFAALRRHLLKHNHTIEVLP